jgi:hypothetical protein
MSASVAEAPRTSWRADRATILTFRYAFGSTLALAIALGIDWQLSYLAPVLALSFLGSPAPRPDLKAVVGFLGIVTVASLVGVAFSALVLPYPMAAMLLVWLALFLLFYWNLRGGHPLLITMLLISVTVIPVVGLMSMRIAMAVAQGLVVAAAAALYVVFIAHTVIPDRPSPGTQAQSAGSEQALPGPHEAAARATLNTLALFPLVAVFFVFQLTSVLILVFAILLSMQPDMTKGFAAGKALVVGNVMGGLAAIAMYELLVMVPQFGFLILLTLFASLWFGRRLFGGGKAAPLFGMAFSTLILVIGSTTSSYGDAGAKAWTRVVQIILAVLYLVLAFGALTYFRGKKTESSHATA